MENATRIGMNKTGIKSSPFDTRALLEVSDEAAPAIPGPETELVALKLDYARQSDALGSVPPPATVKGAVKSGVDAIKGARPQVVFDKIAERLAFERTGVRLYEALLVKHEASDGLESVVPKAELMKIRDEEAAHFRLLVESMESLGGDPTAQTPCAAATGIAGQGLMQLVNDPRTNFIQSLHALHVAELADVDGWAILIEVARSAGHPKLAEAFHRAEQQEERHLANVRKWMLALTKAELGKA
jgi:ferritin-like protein